MSITYFPNSVPPGVFPPATVRLKMCSASVTPAGGLDPQSISVVPWVPGTPPGILTPCQWLVTDIYFEVQTAASAGNTTLQIQRSTAHPFTFANNVNNTPVTILPLAYIPAIRPPFIDNPVVNSGELLQANYVLGTGVGGFTTYVVLTQLQGS